ncbi:MAG: DUF4404 family protein [Pseudoalteromonas distincta]|jgi:hypothetical protein|tara:strand:+ start:7661 stop:7939 length:279 start_codon:yes stop_codon:yes gene_type:complete
MPARQLKIQLESLQHTLNETDGPMSEEEREALQALADNIEARLLAIETNADVEGDPTLVDGVNLMIEQFSARHPTVAATLQSVGKALADMGI